MRPSPHFVSNLQLEQQHIRATRQSADVLPEFVENLTAADQSAARNLASFFANVAQARLNRTPGAAMVAAQNPIVPPPRVFVTSLATPASFSGEGGDGELHMPAALVELVA